MKWKSSESGLNTGFLKGYEEMKKVMFVCWGNICRSPMAEFVFKKMVEERHLSGMFDAASCAISSEEIWNGRGNPVYPQARRILAEHGISCEGKRAVQLKKSDYERYDFLIGMDAQNIRNMERMTGHQGGKIHTLLEFCGSDASIADPWYTGEFERTYRDIVQGCTAFLEHLRATGEIE